MASGDYCHYINGNSFFLMLTVLFFMLDLGGFIFLC